jgi:hypothetical protein
MKIDEYTLATNLVKLRFAKDFLWRVHPQSDEMREQIAEITRLLDELITPIQRHPALPDVASETGDEV